jgi:hypothetical protein
MLKALLILIMTTVSLSLSAQEIPVMSPVPSGFTIKRLEIRPSLSNLQPEVFTTGKFRIRTVNFDTDNEPRTINIAEYMAQEQRIRSSRIIELAPPVQPTQPTGTITFGKTENISATPRFFNQSFSPEMPGRGTKNSVYKDAGDDTGANYLNTYSPFYRRYPYSY